MSAVSILSLGLCIILIGTSFLRRADVFAPYRLFGIIWSLAIGLADLKFSYYQHDWSAYSWIVLLTGVVSMMLGFMAVGVTYLNEPFLGLPEIRRKISQEQVNERRLFAVICTLSVLYAAGLYIESRAAGGLPAFSPRPDRARVDFGLFGVHIFVTMMPAILLLATQYLILFRKNQSVLRILTIVIASAFVFITFSLLLQRFSFVMWAFPTLVFIYYGTNKIKVKHILLLAASFVLFLQILESVRITGYVENYIYTFSRMKFPVKYAIFAEPYMYIVMNLENFTRSVDMWTNFTYGYFTFDFVMALSGLKHPLAQTFGLVERPFLISGYNTFSFFMPFFQDFGIIGVAGIPLCLGLGIGYLYNVIRRRPTLANVSFYAIGAYILAISFFIHALGMLTAVSNVVMLGFAYYYIRMPVGRPGAATGENYRTDEGTPSSS